MKTYRISELARRLGLSRSTLLYYDRIGLLTPNGRSESEYRIYTQDNLNRLERICFFREAGLGLEEIGRILDHSQTENSILEKRLQKISVEMTALKSQQRLIAGILKTVSDNSETSGLDKKLWLSLQRASGLNEQALRNWHHEFERKAPNTHHGFLLGLGLSEKETLHVRMLTKNMEDNTAQMKYFYELFEDLPRQGPGCKASTLKALELIQDLPRNPRVLDIGCGSGVPTLILAEMLKTKILAIDNHKPMLDHLDCSSAKLGFDIETRELSMIDMPFDKESFDLLWAEGSIFIIGLTKGIKDFYRFLKQGGYLAFTEMCWFNDNPPAEIKNYFEKVYPDIKSVDTISALIAENGYQLIESFNLPEYAWLENYLIPLQERIKGLAKKNSGIKEAEVVYENCHTEFDMYKRHSKNYGYTFFIAQKRRES